MNPDVVYLIRLGDTALVAGQRLAEWCGHGPILEEDIALTNISLDLIGQARMLLDEAGKREGQGRTEDTLAFHRDVFDFYNLQITEQPNGDFGCTIAKIFFLSAFQFVQYKALLESEDAFLKAFAAKSLKEVQYHVKHARDWVVRLGDGTQESHSRMQAGIDQMWPFTGEFFGDDDKVEEALNASGIAPLNASLEAEWMNIMDSVLAEATLTKPDTARHFKGGKTGNHTEHLGYLIAEMQFLPRAYPDATW